MKYGLPQSTIQKICAVLSRYPAVEKAILYGSRAKGSEGGKRVGVTKGAGCLIITLVSNLLVE